MEKQNWTFLIAIGFIIFNSLGSEGTAERLPTKESSSEAKLTLQKWIHGCTVSIILAIMTIKLWQYYIRHTHDHFSKLPIPPGSVGFPVLGETLPFVIDGRNYFRSRIKKHGFIFTSHLLGSPTVVVCGAENVHNILTKDAEFVTGCIPPSFPDLFGKGTMACTADQDEYRLKFKMIRNMFGHSMLDYCVRQMQLTMRSTLKEWVKKGEILAVKEVKKLSLAISIETVLGFNLGSDETEEILRHFCVLSDNIFSFPFDLPGSGYRKAKYAKEKLVKIIASSISNEEIASGSMLSTLLNNNIHKSTSHTEDFDSNLSELYNLIIELVFGSYLTVASGCSFIMLHLAENPKLRLSANEEIQAKLHNMCDTDLITLHDLDKLYYSKSVVNETLRLNPPIAGGFRKVVKTFEMQGFQIPKGWVILYCITDTHENSTMFKEDILNFNPNRWNDSNTSQNNIEQKSKTLNPSESRSQYTDQKQETNNKSYNGNYASKCDYFPFGAGKRLCPGKEYAKLFLKIFTVELCRQYEWTLVDEKRTNSKIKTAPIPFPSDDMPLFISRIAQ